MKRAIALLLAFVLVTSWAPEQWLRAEVVGDTVRLTWTDPTEGVDNLPLQELQGIRIYEAGTAGGPYTQIAQVAPGVQEYWTGPLAEGDHFYVATAYNSAGESDYSNEVLIEVFGAIVRPKAPGSLAVVR